MRKGILKDMKQDMKKKNPKYADMNIMDIVEVAKKSEYGMVWYSPKGPIYISTKGEISPVFTNNPPHLNLEEE